MKNDTYQGKWKVKDPWSETEYVVVRKVADGVPAYEVKDEVGNVKTIHHNQLFLVAIPMEAITPLGVGASISEENVAQSTLVEHTSYGVESNSPEGSMDRADTLSPTSRVPLGWVGGVLQPLPSVALRLTMWRGLEAGDGVLSQSNEEVHQTCWWDLRTLLVYSEYQMLRGVGAQQQQWELSFWDHIKGGHYNPTDDDPKWEPKGGARPPCTSL